MSSFNPAPILKYLSLPPDYDPSPEKDPISFLRIHLHHLPDSHLLPFTQITTPQQRATLTGIRNRRTVYITTGYGREKLSWSEARKHDPIGYESHMITVSGSSGMPLAPDPTDSRQYRRGEEEGIDEKRWAEEEFLSGAKKYVGGGKLGSLLGQFEEERRAQSLRDQRRKIARRELEDQPVEETEDEDEDEGERPRESLEEAKSSYERMIRDRFIAGELEWTNYDEVDFDENLDPKGAEDQERWFDDEEEE